MDQSPRFMFPPVVSQVKYSPSLPSLHIVRIKADMLTNLEQIIQVCPFKRGGHFKSRVIPTFRWFQSTLHMCTHREYYYPHDKIIKVKGLFEQNSLLITCVYTPASHQTLFINRWCGGWLFMAWGIRGIAVQSRAVVISHSKLDNCEKHCLEDSSVI